MSSVFSLAIYGYTVHTYMCLCAPAHDSCQSSSSFPAVIMFNDQFGDPSLVSVHVLYIHVQIEPKRDVHTYVTCDHIKSYIQ